MTIDKTVAVIGGTGHLGAALAGRWAKAGIRIVIGSRDAARAQAAADGVGHGATGAANAEAAAQADIVVLAVPFAAQTGTIADIRDAAQGKIVVDTTVPLVPPKVMRVQLPAEGSAAARTQALLGEGVTLISAFHNVAAHKLATDEDVDCDVLVFGDDKAARETGIALAEAAAKAKGHEVKVGRFPFIGNGKAIALGEPEGLVKTVFDAKTGELLGAHMVGAEVTELIQGYTVAKTLETTEAELMQTIFPHPTLSEMMHESVLAAYGRTLHM